MIKENSKFHLFNELKISSGNNKNKLLMYDLWYKYLWELGGTMMADSYNFSSRQISDARRKRN
jgi:hypothetical protein